MEMDFNGDLVSLDAELLQLPEIAPLALKSNPYLAQELFEQWLSLSETNRLVCFFLPSMGFGDSILLDEVFFLSFFELLDSLDWLCKVQVSR